MRKALYILWQLTWGFPQSLAGFVLFLAHARCPHSTFHGAVATTWPRAASVSLGMFVFVTDHPFEAGKSGAALPQEQAARRLLVHEYGHTVQSLVLGPAYLLVVGLPSLLWAYLPPARRRRSMRKASYYTFVTERSANRLGQLVCREPAPR